MTSLLDSGRIGVTGLWNRHLTMSATGHLARRQDRVIRWSEISCLMAVVARKALPYGFIMR
ncbi:hypothetical protein C1S82_05060 [Mycolicibacterium cosmeticum]|nr:hypothetical protein C1S82_05060 [Mycolicibacterium cosmeticum]